MVGTSVFLLRNFFWWKEFDRVLDRKGHATLIVNLHKKNIIELKKKILPSHATHIFCRRADPAVRFAKHDDPLLSNPLLNFGYHFRKLRRIFSSPLVEAKQWITARSLEVVNGRPVKSMSDPTAAMWTGVWLLQLLLAVHWSSSTR